MGLFSKPDDIFTYRNNRTIEDIIPLLRDFIERNNAYMQNVERETDALSQFDEPSIFAIEIAIEGRSRLGSKEWGFQFYVPKQNENVGPSEVTFFVMRNVGYDRKLTDSKLRELVNQLNLEFVKHEES